MNYFRYSWILLLATVLPFSGCKKLIEADFPINEIVGKEIFNTNVTATSVLTGLYTSVSGTNFFDISLKTGLSADEFAAITSGDIFFALYTNSLSNPDGNLFWTQYYEFIFRINSALGGLEASTALSPDVKTRLIGESKFLRAFLYFYLVNMFGDVPLLLTTNAFANSVAGRTETAKVYEQIIIDLQDAKAALTNEYLGPDVASSTSERLRPNKYAATAMLARVYLYTEKWAAAEQEATELIDAAPFDLEPLNAVFLRASKEAIWQLQPTDPALNTPDGNRFVLFEGKFRPAGPEGYARPAYLSDEIFKKFEAGDLRRDEWTDSVIVSGVVYPFPYKYKAFDLDQPRTEYTMVLRLAEQYLIRAEARAYQGKLVGENSAAADLNIIRDRAGLGETTATSQEDLLTAIIHERKFELFTEWGHRWFDLKRTGRIDEVMSVVTPLKGNTWQPYQALYPIPFYDLQANPSLRGKQNPGYPER